MFTFSLLYVIFYYQLLYILFIYIKLYFNINTLQQFNFSQILILLKNYSSHTNYFSFIFLLLSGLPPVNFFLLKLIFLITNFQYISFFMQLVLFLNFLLGMLFYLQCFNITNNNYINNINLKKLNMSSMSILVTKRYSNSYYRYIYWVLYISVVSIHIFGFFIFFDVLIIINALI